MALAFERAIEKMAASNPSAVYEEVEVDGGEILPRLRQGGAVVVMYSPMCGHCHNFADTFRELMDKFGDSYEFLSASNNLPSVYGVGSPGKYKTRQLQGVPTILVSDSRGTVREADDRSMQGMSRLLEDAGGNLSGGARRRSRSRSRSASSSRRSSARRSASQKKVDCEAGYRALDRFAKYVSDLGPEHAERVREYFDTSLYNANLVDKDTKGFVQWRRQRDAERARAQREAIDAVVDGIGAAAADGMKWIGKQFSWTTLN